MKEIVNPYRHIFLQELESILIHDVALDKEEGVPKTTTNSKKVGSVRTQ